MDRWVRLTPEGTQPKALDATAKVAPSYNEPMEIIYVNDKDWAELQAELAEDSSSERTAELFRTLAFKEVA